MRLRTFLVRVLTVLRRLLMAAGGSGGSFPVPDRTIIAEPQAGGWTEVEGPHAVYGSGVTYIGWTGGNAKPKDIEVASWDGTTATAATLLHDALADGTGSTPDSHEGPALVYLPDGKLLVAYMGHQSGQFRSRRSTSADDISAFDTEVVKDPSTGLLTYPQLSYMSSIDRVYLTFRHQGSGGGSWQMRCHSDDHGSTWANGTDFYASDDDNHYSAFASDGIDTIHFAVTDVSPVDATYGLYYFKMDASSGDLFAADGTAFSTSLPLHPSGVTQLVAAGDAYPYSVGFTNDGRPVIACQSKFSDPVEIFEYRWTGSAWVRNDITTSDPISPSILSVGGGMHVWGDASRFITSRMSGGELVVSEYRTTDDGATWTHHADYGSGSSPVYVRDGVDAVGLWFAPASSFTDSDTFDPGLAGVP